MLDIILAVLLTFDKLRLSIVTVIAMKMMMLAIMRLVTWNIITINKCDDTMNEVNE